MAVDEKGVVDLLRKKIDTDPDFVALPRYRNSLKAVCDAHPNGCSDKIIAQALQIPEDQVETVYTEAVTKIQSALRLR